jgi:hypothetical protein
MKVAQHPKNQQPITASNTAPDKAVCPHCGGVVVLRRRKCMGGECVYFWRHQDNQHWACNGRSHALYQ